MTTSMSRRSMIAGAAALPAAAVLPAVALAAEPDPIFAAIEAHKAANVTYSRTCSLSTNMRYDAPGYAEADAATTEACHAERDAAIDLTRIAPTTRTGIDALLAYVLDNDRDYPGHDDWPTEMTAPDVLDYTGEPAVMPFHFWLLRNVRDSLAVMGA
jgi:hypothetical protein